MLIFEIQNLTKHCNEALILAILSLEKKHGYQIALELEGKSNGLFKFNHGTLYPILHKLEKDKLIKGTRKYYTLTAKGKKYTEALLYEWEKFSGQFFHIVGDAEK